ncbi:hypothetical protein [Ectopseudomonas guguanensis]|uniref:hypothetical protein n=1 Tax=Ectopseudomonas guguanensis TaxID=1198456 RepID=UPI0028592EE4|nr:hypothetical protein [Pseudomonas guguanensis]MDR8016534.1 hypothetical protein [Pseudomonas guguanensis]
MLHPLSRRKAEVLTVLNSVSQEDHLKLKQLGAADNKFWSTDDEAHAPLVAAFRTEVKDYYWGRQARRCCYCSKELDESKAAYDAEHIIHKDEFPQFMFELANLSVACRTCNGVKKNKLVLALNVMLAEVPRQSGDYTIVHPHLDEWSDHFRHDKISRIVPANGSMKGAKTIELCGIHYLNAARLADYFLPADHKTVQQALEGLFRVKSRGWKIKYLEVLNGLVDEHNFQPAREILGALKDEV